jgi:hypothetical protein
MKFTILLLLIILFSSCDSSNDASTLRNENNALQEKVTLLEAQIAELKKSPTDLVNDVKNNVRNGDLTAAKEDLVKITSSQLSSRQLNNINKLLSAVNNKLEEKDFKNLSESDTTLYNDFINNYPKSKYVGVVKKRLRKFRQVQEVESNYSVNTRHYHKKGYSENNETTRVGAICCDGTRSYATGRGACSHHGAFVNGYTNKIKIYPL